MLFMVIERFKHADPKPIGERFRQSGRRLPEGVTYHASWVDVTAVGVSRPWRHPGGNCSTVWIAQVGGSDRIRGYSSSVLGGFLVATGWCLLAARCLTLGASPPRSRWVE